MVNFPFLEYFYLKTGHILVHFDPEFGSKLVKTWLASPMAVGESLVLPEWRLICSPTLTPLHSDSVVKVTKKDGGGAENKNTNTRIHSCFGRIVREGGTPKGTREDWENCEGSVGAGLGRKS